MRDGRGAREKRSVEMFVSGEKERARTMSSLQSRMPHLCAFHMREGCPAVERCRVSCSYSIHFLRHVLQSLSILALSMSSFFGESLNKTMVRADNRNPGTPCTTGRRRSSRRQWLLLTWNCSIIGGGGYALSLTHSLTHSFSRPFTRQTIALGHHHIFPTLPPIEDVF